MIIAKKGQKITDFQCFHERYWKMFWGENVRMGVGERREN